MGTGEGQQGKFCLLEMENSAEEQQWMKEPGNNSHVAFGAKTTSGMHREGGKSIFKAVKFPRGSEERW